MVDSIDALASAIGSPTSTILFLRSLLSTILATSCQHYVFFPFVAAILTYLLFTLSAKSRLILHTPGNSPLLPSLLSVTFSSTLTVLTSHPPSLLLRIAQDYMTPPPPLSRDEKFWNVFQPIAQRHNESEKLVFGADAKGSEADELVVEVLVRGGAEGMTRRRGVERTLEGWRKGPGLPCKIEDLESLRTLFVSRRAIFEVRSHQYIGQGDLYQQLHPRHRQHQIRQKISPSILTSQPSSMSLGHGFPFLMCTMETVSLRPSQSSFPVSFMPLSLCSHCFPLSPCDFARASYILRS